MQQPVHSLTIMMLFALSLSLSQTSTLLATEPIDIGTRLEPMIDDYLIDSLTGEAKLQLHRPVEREIAITHDHPWEGDTSTYATVFKDGNIYRMYYRASTIRHKKTAHKYLCYAESTDGINWVKPNLGLVAHQGSKDNNILDIRGNSLGNFAAFIDTNPEVKPDEKYKAIVSAKGGLGIYKSADAMHWEFLADHAVITDGKFDSLNTAMFDNYRNRYVAFYRDVRNDFRDIKTATSDDGVNWSDSQWLEYTGAPNEHLYTNAIVSYHRAPHVFIGMPMRFIPDRQANDISTYTGTSDAVFMTSRDGETFHRWPEAVVRPGPRDLKWVNRNNMPTRGILETPSTIPGQPNELSIYVSEGYFSGQAVSQRRYTWRLDGFVSINAPAVGGQALTKPIIFGDRDSGYTSKNVQMRVNMSTSAAGSVIVELQDVNGKPIPGFTASDCDVIYGDEIARTVTWNGESNIKNLAGRAVRLCIQLKDADVYAIQFTTSN